MARITKENELNTKILLLGMSPSGKTSFLEILYKMTKEEYLDIKPTSELIKISMASGGTLYFDKAVFQSTLDSNEFYEVITVPGQRRFAPLRKKVLKGTDGIIFFVNASKKFLRDNILSLKELVNLVIKKDYGEKRFLIKDIPLTVILNKRASDDRIIKKELIQFFSHESITKKDVIQFLTEEGLWYEPNHELFIWNPTIFETSILYENRSEIYHCFSECARRTRIYSAIGDGKAPHSKKSKGEKKSISSQNLTNSPNQITRTKKRDIKGSPELAAEEPLALLIIGSGGFTVFSYSFSDEWKSDNELFGSCISAFSDFSDEVFSKDLNGARFGDNTLLIQQFDSYSLCYLFREQISLAEQRLVNFKEHLQNNTSLLQKINRCFYTSQTLELKDSPSLKTLITKIFIKKEQLIKS